MQLMTTDELKKVYRRMLWVVPGMLLAMIGDYCMGIEPKDSYAVTGMISSGWLTIADWRIAVSNIGGLIGTACYTVAALPFAAFLKTLLQKCKGKWDRRFLKLYIAGLILGVMCFLYFHLECGTLIHNFNVIYEAAGGNTGMRNSRWKCGTVPIWSRSSLIGSRSLLLSSLYYSAGLSSSGKGHSRLRRRGFWRLR